MSEWWTAHSTAGVARDKEDEIDINNTITNASNLTPGLCYEYNTITSIDKHNTNNTLKYFTHLEPFVNIGKFISTNVVYKKNDEGEKKIAHKVLTFNNNNTITKLKVPHKSIPLMPLMPIFKLISCPILRLETMSRQVVKNNIGMYGSINEPTHRLITDTVGEGPQYGGKSNHKRKKTKKRKTKKRKTKKTIKRKKR